MEPLIFGLQAAFWWLFALQEVQNVCWQWMGGGGGSASGGAKGRRENYGTAMATLKGTDRQVEWASTIREAANSGIDTTIDQMKKAAQPKQVIEQGVSRMERIRSEINRTERASELIDTFGHAVRYGSKNAAESAAGAIAGAVRRQDSALAKRMRKAFDGK